MPTHAIEPAIIALLDKYEIAREHSSDALAEADSWQKRPGIDDPLLSDWTSLPFVTIDNEDSRDLDQALLIEQNEDGGYRVRYALADAAYYVPPGSALFNDALQRGVTYYTPAYAAPMLPPNLSEGLVSLNPDVKRRALVFDMQLKPSGECANTTIVRACIKSVAKLSYNGVQALLDAHLPSDSTHNDPIQDTEPTSPAYLSSLLLLRTLGELLMQKALDRDVIPFKRNETQISISAAGDITMAQRKRPRTEKYNEQLSLLCNMQGALMLTQLSASSEELQAVYRVHDAPLQGRLKALRRLLEEFAEQTNLSQQWRWHKDQSLADYVNALPSDTAMQHVRAAVERQILVCNQSSEYQSEPGRHHALAAESYARFSAPMRELVGVFTHKELLEALVVTPSPLIGDAAFEVPPDATLREQVIRVANESRARQKRLSKEIALLALEAVLTKDLETDTPPVRTGTIMGFKRERAYIACNDIAVDLKVDGADIAKQHDTQYQFDNINAKASDAGAPSWQLGEAVGVITLGYNKEHRRFMLGLCKLK